MFKRYAALLLALALTASLAACAGDNTATTSPAADSAGDTATDNATGDADDTADAPASSGDSLTILTADDMVEGGGLHNMAAAYTEATGNPTEVVEIPYGDMESKILNMIRAGDSPGVVRFAGFSVFLDYLVDLTDIAPDPGDLLLSTVSDGKVMALPANVTANGMVYNKTLFDQAGITAPTSEDDIWTWDEFRANLQTIVDSTDAQYGLVWDHSQQRFATMVYQYGGALYSDDMTKITIGNEKGRSAIEDFVAMFDNGLMPKSTWAGTEDPQAMFRTGMVAVHMAGNWVLSDYAENITDFEWAPMYMPKGEQRATIPGGNFIYAVEGSGTEQEAKDFLSWFYEPENYAQYCAYNNYLPGRRGVTVDYAIDGLEIFQKEMEATPNSTRVYEAIGLKYPNGNPGNVLRDGLDEMIAGTMTVDDVIETTEAAFIEAYQGLEADRS